MLEVWILLYKREREREDKVMSNSQQRIIPCISRTDEAYFYGIAKYCQNLRSLYKLATISSRESHCVAWSVFTMFTQPSHMLVCYTVFWLWCAAPFPTSYTKCARVYLCVDRLLCTTSIIQPCHGESESSFGKKYSSMWIRIKSLVARFEYFWNRGFWLSSRLSRTILFYEIASISHLRLARLTMRVIRREGR